MSKTVEQYFVDWESHTFGFGYGTGEPHVLPALKTFFDCLGRDGNFHAYDHQRLESVLTPTVAWLLINTLCGADILEYGTSPRYGWLTIEGQALREFIDTKSADELVELCTAFDDEQPHCGPDYCNCGPKGYEAGRICGNPFWDRRLS